MSILSKVKELFLFDNIGYRLMREGNTQEAVRYFGGLGDIGRIREIVRKECQEYGPQSAQILINTAIGSSSESTTEKLGDMLLRWYGNTRDAIAAYAKAGNVDKIIKVISKECQEYGPQSAQILVSLAKDTLTKLGRKEEAEKVEIR